MQTFNHYLFSLINANADTANWLIILNVFIAKKLIYIIPVLLVLTWILGKHNQRKAALYAFIITAIALMVNHIIGIVMPTDRPFVLQLGNSFLEHAPTASFPSNHLAIFACIAIGYYSNGLKHIGYLLAFTGVVVAWARVFVGVHFPLDMLGAVIVSIIVYALTKPAWYAIGDKTTSFFENIYRAIFKVINVKIH